MLNQAVCDVCKPGFYKKINGQYNECISIPSEYPNCKVYTDNNKCEECNQGYALADIKGNPTMRVCVKLFD